MTQLRNATVALSLHGEVMATHSLIIFRYRAFLVLIVLSGRAIVVVDNFLMVAIDAIRLSIHLLCHSFIVLICAINCAVVVRYSLLIGCSIGAVRSLNLGILSTDFLIDAVKLLTP